MENETKGQEGHDYTPYEGEITQEQMLDAASVVRKYFKQHGTLWTRIDWSHKPVLPDDVSEAWDIYSTFWAEIRRQDIKI